MLGHKTSLNTFWKIEIIQSIFSVHSGMKLEISDRKSTKNLKNMWNLNSTLLKNQQVKEEIIGEIRK